MFNLTFAAWSTLADGAGTPVVSVADAAVRREVVCVAHVTAKFFTVHCSVVFAASRLQPGFPC